MIKISSGLEFYYTPDFQDYKNHHPASLTDRVLAKIKYQINSIAKKNLHKKITSGSAFYHHQKQAFFTYVYFVIIGDIAECLSNAGNYNDPALLPDLDYLLSGVSKESDKRRIISGLNKSYSFNKYFEIHPITKKIHVRKNIDSKTFVEYLNKQEYMECRRHYTNPLWYHHSEKPYLVTFSSDYRKVIEMLEDLKAMSMDIHERMLQESVDIKFEEFEYSMDKFISDNGIAAFFTYQTKLTLH